MWSKIIKETFFFQSPLYLIVKDSSENICGTFSGFIVRNINGNKTIYSTRFGLIANNQEIATKMFDYIYSFSLKNKVKDILITSGFKKYKTNFHNFKKISMVMELKNDSDWLWKEFSSKTRNAIRRGYKNNFTLSHDLKYLNDFHIVYKKKNV